MPVLPCAARPLPRLLLPVLGALTLLTGCAALDRRQADLPAPGISREEFITLDGQREWLLVRGRDPTHNPVLLFLHGGPGFPAAPFGRVNSELEQDFTVVHWDQRGAGHSYTPDVPPKTLRVEQFVRETLELSHALCRRFHQPKIYLVGYSWGTLPGILAVQREPGLFYAYVGLGQVVDVADAERRMAGDAESRARAAGELDTERALRSLGPGSYADPARADLKTRLVEATRPRVAHEATSLRLALLALGSRYYSVREMIDQVLPGYRLSRQKLNPQLYAFHLKTQVPRLDAPVAFFTGRHDTTVGGSLVAEYAAGLRAPRGKRFVWFEQSAHTPHLEEPEKFAAELRRLRAETWRGPNKLRNDGTNPELPAPSSF